MNAPMLSVAEARARILDGLRPCPPETVALSEAAGRVLAQPVRARLTQPPADLSAMDGYALRAVDGPLDAVLRVIGEAPAGHPFAGHVGPGEAVRLFTGSVLPPGADCVVIQEDVCADGDRIQLREAARAGRHIRRAGQDFTAGAAVLAAGRRLTPRDIGLAAAANHPWLIVHRRPRVAILATGDEIALPGEPIPSGGIVSSNAHALAALVRAGGGAPVVLPIAGDDPALIAGVVEASAGMDLLLTTGGASVGAHDLVQAALVARGMALDFWRIAMRPGKPLIFGRLGTTPVLGLPGNPVSTMVCAVIYLLPALARFGGEMREVPASEPAWLGAALPANDHRADFLRARLHRDGNGRLIATAFERQDSSLLSVLAAADALILRPPHAEASAAGECVSVIRLDLLGV